MASDVTIEEAEATLDPSERLMWNAVNCGDLEFDLTIKLAHELLKLSRRTKSPPEVTRRVKAAQNLMGHLMSALHPETLRMLWKTVMLARVEHNLLMSAAEALLSTTEETGREAASLRVAHIIEDIRERHELV